MDNIVWAHDRQENRSFASSPKKIANENGMYPEEIEQYFANEIEDPAKLAIENIRNKVLLSDDERAAIAKYIVALWKRVPKGRDRVIERMPKISESVRENLHRQIEDLVTADTSLESIAESRRAEIDEILARYKADPPPEIWYRSLSTESTPRMVDALLSMQWRFLFSNHSQFLTSDNPVFFFEDVGIAKPTSELTLPFSSSISLWANRRVVKGSTYLEARPIAIKELNRRTVSNATRFVYSARDEKWILPFVHKRDHVLNWLT